MIDDLYLFLYVAEKTGQRTVPNVFVNGNHIGGNDDTHKEGSWKPLYKSEIPIRVPYSQRKSARGKKSSKRHSETGTFFRHSFLDVISRGGQTHVGFHRSLQSYTVHRVPISLTRHLPPPPSRYHQILCYWFRGRGQ